MADWYSRYWCLTNCKKNANGSHLSHNKHYLRSGLSVGYSVAFCIHKVPEERVIFRSTDVLHGAPAEHRACFDCRRAFDWFTEPRRSARSRMSAWPPGGPAGTDGRQSTSAAARNVLHSRHSLCTTYTTISHSHATDSRNSATGRRQHVIRMQLCGNAAYAAVFFFY